MDKATGAEKELKNGCLECVNGSAGFLAGFERRALCATISLTTFCTPFCRYIKMIVMPQLGKMEIKTTSGEAKTYTNYKELEASSMSLMGRFLCAIANLRVGILLPLTNTRRLFWIDSG